MRSAPLIALALVAVLTLSACSGGEEQPGDSAPERTSSTPIDGRAEQPGDSGQTPTPTASPSTPPAEAESAAPSIEVRINGEKVAPNAEELSLGVGETMVWEIVSDRAGELHVHSKPEQYVEFGDGETRAEMTVETPGSVEVEDHETGVTVAILQVR